MAFGKGVEKVAETAGKIVDVVDQVVLDKDAAYEKKVDLVRSYIENMLGGAGASVTKYTICGLVSLVVGALTWAFLFSPNMIERAIQYAGAVTPIIGILTGSYLTGTSVQTILKRRDR